MIGAHYGTFLTPWNPYQNDVLLGEISREITLIFISMSDIIMVLDNNRSIIMILDFYYTYSFLSQVLDLIFFGGKKRDLSPYININRF